jgi:acetate kinase
MLGKPGMRAEKTAYFGARTVGVRGCETRALTGRIWPLGSLVAALGGIDALVFTAGIGENDRATRAEVLRGAAWAGFDLDEAANAQGGPRITHGARPSAWVIPTDGS